MRILVTIDRMSATGGREMVALQLSKELARRGHHIDVLYQCDGDLVGEYRSFCDSIRQAPISLWPPAPLRKLARAAPSIWAGMRRGPDVVYLHSFGDIPFGALAARLARAPLVCHLHGMSHFNKRELLAGQVSRFIAVSEDTRQKWIRSGLDPVKVVTVHNGIDPDQYPFGNEADRSSARMALGLPSDAFVVLYYGRLDAGKGVEVLLEAWRHLDVSPREARLVFVAQSVLDSDPAGYTRRTQALAPPGCEWLPMRRDVVTPLHAADAVALPSFAEGFGRTVIEAMSTGRPAIASRVGGIREILSGEFGRFMSEPGDSKGLAHNIASLMNWREADPGLGGRCRDHVKERFSLKGSTDRVEQVLRTVISRHT